MSELTHKQRRAIAQRIADQKWGDFLERRNKAVERLHNSLKHLPLPRIIAIITAGLLLEDLEKLAEFQASKDND